MLARELGMTVGELLRRMHPRELTEWEAFYHLEEKDREKARKEAEKAAKRKR